jgi:hypothetical protein
LRTKTSRLLLKSASVVTSRAASSCPLLSRSRLQALTRRKPKIWSQLQTKSVPIQTPFGATSTSASLSRFVNGKVKIQPTNNISDKHAIRNGKLSRVRQIFGEGKVIPAERTVELLETVIQPGDRIIHEGDNQKQGDFLAGQLARMNPKKVNGLKLCVSSVGLPEHLDLFENGLATELDFAYAAPQAARLARMVMDGSVKIGDVHTYVELYSRYLPS